MKKLIVFITLLLLSNQLFEVILDRNQQDLDIDLSQQVDLKSISKCPFSQLDGIDTEFSPQLCYKKDLSFTIKVLFGLPFEKDNSVLDIALDITQPWTWVKSDSCQQCSSESTLPSSKSDIQKYQCQQQKKCDGNKVIFTNNQIGKIDKKPTILGYDHILQGSYVYEQMNFLAYDPKKLQNIVTLIQNEIKPEKRLENHSEIIKLKKYKILALNQMQGMEDYKADGSIGLGLMDSSSSYSIEEDSVFLKQLVTTQTDKVMNQTLFSIFINNVGHNVKEQVITFGGINKKLAFREDISKMKWLPILKGTGNYWGLNLNSIRLEFKEFKFIPIHQNQRVNTIHLDNTKSFISLSSSFLSLPKDILEQLIRIFNSYGDTDCIIVDSKYYVVYCKKFSILHEYSMTFELNFGNKAGSKDEQYTVEINSQNLLRQCNEDAEVAHHSDRYDCSLNIQLSHDDNIILGEPFLKQHYTIFDQDNQKIGLIKANDDQNWGITNQIIDLHFGSLFKWLAYTLIFILGAALVLICCLGPIKYGVKGIRNSALKLKHQASFQDVQSLTQSHAEEENSYAEIEAAMREQAMKEIQRMEEKMEQDERKLTMNSTENADEEINNSHVQLKKNNLQEIQ